MEEIQVDTRWEWIKKDKFPKLSPMTQQEVEDIMSLLSSNKAMAFDATSDIIFKDSPLQENRKKPSYRSRAAQKLRDLWRVELDQMLGMGDTWAARLIPLNKVFPDIPTRTQLRPILVQSPLIKLLEARFLPKLQ